MCGESACPSIILTAVSGSPPHVWGKRAPVRHIVSKQGITPTCVGKAPTIKQPHNKFRDHPHMCGESRFYPQWTIESKGSPPHVWGKPTVKHLAMARLRITPTCVGKAFVQAVWDHINRDHPHMCGESCLAAFILSAILGSPPHVWGKLLIQP